MYNPNDYTQKYPFWRLQLLVETHFNEPINQFQQKSPKLISSQIRKHFYKTSGTSV